MISYTKRNINIITFIISVIILITINSVIQIFESHSFNQNIPEEHIEVAEVTEQPTVPQEAVQEEQTPEAVEETSKIEEVKNEWQLEIPAIKLEAPIAEGTDVDTLNKYVGHFQDTSKLNGNVALAAHNRGYPVNYFQNIKSLKKGDEINYRYNGKEITYVIDKIEVIKDTDWTNLQSTKENKITLITCVEDAPMYRRCIQGTQKGSR